jgi:hypothetical protein
MYSGDNNDYVPEEGDTTQPINNAGSTGHMDNKDYAWYNVVPVSISQPSLMSLYPPQSAGQQPLPASSSIFSCPSSPDPTAAQGYSSPLNGNKAYFMYAESSAICVDYSTRYNSSGQSTGVGQTKLSNIQKPSDTIFLAASLKILQCVTAVVVLRKPMSFGAIVPLTSVLPPNGRHRARCIGIHRRRRRIKILKSKQRDKRG